MLITLVRKYPKENYTIGSLFIRKSPHKGGDTEGAVWFCNTLEPPLGTATEAITAGSGKAIPKGTYNVRMAWSQRFQEYMPRLVGVPGRDAILIHAGNNVKNTTGCILVGKNTQVGRVIDSRRTLANLISIIRQAQNNGEAVTININ